MPPPLTSCVLRGGRSFIARWSLPLLLPFFSMASLQGSEMLEPSRIRDARREGEEIRRSSRGGDERVRAPRQPAPPASGHCARCAGPLLTRPRGAIVSGHMISRRMFLAGSLMLLAAPLAAEAQQAGRQVPHIRYLSNSTGRSAADTAFMEGLRDLGYVDGRNIAIEARYTSGNSERFTDFAAELVRLR